MVKMVWGRVGKRNDFEIISAISVVGEGLGGLTLSWMILAVLTIYTIMNGGGAVKTGVSGSSHLRGIKAKIKKTYMHINVLY